MARSIVRFSSGEAIRWGILQGEVPQRATDEVTVAPLSIACETTAQLLASLAPDAPQESALTLSVRDLRSPVTSDARLVCQGLNYRSHSEESAHGKRGGNLIFAKAASALTGAFDAIHRPSEVELLDYEVEVGLLIGRPINHKVDVEAGRLGDYVAGLVLCNDVSARDVMFGTPFLQWYHGKSYRGFCPCGPVLILLDPEECAATVANLLIELSVNGEKRQTGDTANLIFGPAQTLTELSAWMDFSPGDLLLTGTPGGVTASATPAFVQALQSQLFDDEARLASVRRELTRGRPFLQPGDRVTASLTDLRNSQLLAAHDTAVAGPK
jgi:2-keto-4-pentenoate hydratase/2-oxohepta-3-ene-1,7-dioic acid hydratase in catechol pathway